MIEYSKIKRTDDRTGDRAKILKIFKKAFEKGELKKIECIISRMGELEKITPEEMLVLFARIGNPELVRKALYHGADPTDGENAALRWACREGTPEVVELLLQDDRVNPGDLYNWCIRWAVDRRNVKMVILLLNDDRVDVKDGRRTYGSGILADSAYETAKLGNAVVLAAEQQNHKLDNDKDKIYPKIFQILEDHLEKKKKD